MLNIYILDVRLSSSFQEYRMDWIYIHRLLPVHGRPIGNEGVCKEQVERFGPAQPGNRAQNAIKHGRT